MAAKRKSRARSSRTGDRASQAMQQSAHRIWLAGLGAFERAKSEGPKMFEALVAQGKDLRGRAREAADHALKAMRAQAGEAQGKWDKLEQVFEDRVARSLGRLGVLTKAEVGDLSRQVRELNENVRKMMRAGPAPKSRARTATRKKAKAKPRARARKAAKRR